MFSSIHWIFRRIDVLPILEVLGECKIKEVEPILIQTAVYFIEIAKNFNGQAISKTPNCSGSSESAISVAFTLAFPSQKDFKQFMALLPKH